MSRASSRARRHRHKDGERERGDGEIKSPSKKVTKASKTVLWASILLSSKALEVNDPTTKCLEDKKFSK